MEENTPITPPSPHFPTGKKEVQMGIILVILSVFLADFLVYGGLNLGFALMSIACTGASTVYLLRSGCKLTLYSAALLIMNLIIAASFVRSDDVLVKMVMLCFLLISGNLGLTLIAGQNRRNAGGLTSLLDAPMAIFTLGVGELPNSFGGLNDARKNAGEFGKKNIAVLTGLAVAVPVLAILIPLLMSADAAFEGLLNLLPEIDFAEPVVAIIIGVPLACVAYTRNVALKHRPKKEAAPVAIKTVSHITINTVLIAVSVLYLVYLFSQLAYFVGGFAGILPEEFTMAEYARRGFFEMAWLSGINLGIIALAVGLADRKDGKLSLTTRIMCLFIGIVSLFFTATASAKMSLYIDSYGLTRLRLLTEVIMVFIALTALLVLLWLFRPKFAYMKAVLLAGLIIGAAVSWADVDTLVANYNVSAYQSGQLKTVDVHYLGSLGDGAIPALQKLTEDKVLDISGNARKILLRRAEQLQDDDIRGWNIAQGTARSILTKYKEEAAALQKAEEALQQAEEELQKAVDNFPLQVLTVYGDVADGARNLIAFYPDLPHENDSLLLYVEDASLKFADGTPLIDVPVSYSAKFQIYDSGVTSIEITSSYALFRTDEAPYGAMVWVESPDMAKAQLSILYPGMTLTPGRDNWYTMILPDAL